MENPNIDVPRGIAIETCSMCNRRCQWCPQSTHHRERAFLPKELFLKVIKELKDIKYEGKIGLHIFNEPLMDGRINDLIKEVRLLLPEIYLYIHTNGDLLNEERLQALKNSGLSMIHINQYDGEITPRIQKIVSDFNAANFIIKIRRFKPRRHVSNRAGLVKTESVVPIRKSCRRIWQMCINYKGDVILCCNDYLGQVNVGNIKDKSLLELFNDPTLKKYRAALKRGNRELLKLCDKCDL